jgi:hypothetical protein
MSELTITHAGSTITRSADSPGSSTSGKYKIIRVTPTLTEDSAYADGDVLFTATEIPNAVKSDGGCSKLMMAYVLDADRDTVGFDLIFTQKNTALGTIHATADISAPNMQAIGFCGAMHYSSGNNQINDLDTVKIAKCSAISSVNASVEPMLLQAEEGTTSVYVSGLITSGTPEFAETDDITLILHIDYS